MPQTKEKVSPKQGRFRRAASAIGRLFRRRSTTQTPRHDDAVTRHARPAHIDSDIPMKQIEEAYTPTQTSLKGPFRASGADRQRDQEFAGGYADSRWNDEDRLTNKSGDPRIGTHGRTYEPGEQRVASGRSDDVEYESE